MNRARSNGRLAIRVGSLAIIALALPCTALANATEPAAPDPQAEPAKVTAPVKTPKVSRAQFTTRVVDREPTDRIERLAIDRHRILFYSELRGLAGQNVTHRWEREGHKVAEVSFRVDANRWRVWSSKNLEPGGIGNWTVSVVTDDGVVLATRSFVYHE